MTIYGKGCISNYRNCSLCYVWYSVLYRMLTADLCGAEQRKKVRFMTTIVIHHDNKYNKFCT